MSKLMEYTSYLAKEIGPRPAGSKEEQEAALFITERFQKDAGFAASIEEFQGSTKPDLPRAILAAVVVLCGVLAIFLPVVHIFAFLIAAAATVVCWMEGTGKQIISQYFGKSASQNVVAKYSPTAPGNDAPRGVTRKLILVAHYDSGSVTPGVVKALEKAHFSCAEIGAIAMAATSVLLLLRVFLAAAGGGVLVILNVLTALTCVASLAPVLKMVLSANAPLNEGANNNATGTAALLEIARRISSGSVSEADLVGGVAGYGAGAGAAGYGAAGAVSGLDVSAGSVPGALGYGGEPVVMHGADALINAGLVPVGIDFVYEGTANIEGAGAVSPEAIAAAATAGIEIPSAPVQAALSGAFMAGTNEEARLLAAKEAIAALTGKPVERRIFRGVDVAAGAAATGSIGAGIAAATGAISGSLGADVSGAVVPTAVVPTSENVGLTGDVPLLASLVDSSSGPLPSLQSLDEIAEVSPATAIDVEFAQAASSWQTSAPLAEAAAAIAEGAAGAGAAGAGAAGAGAGAAGQDTVGGFTNAPAWFAAAQRNAKRTESDVEIQRSRFTEAMDNAERERQRIEEEARAEEEARRAAEMRAREAEVRASIANRERAAAAAKAEAEAAAAAAAAAAAEAAAAEAAAAAAVLPEAYASATSTNGTSPAELAVTSSEAYASATSTNGASPAEAAQATPAPADPFAAITAPSAVGADATGELTPADARVDRLRSLRTNVPSLSGVIRTKSEARKAAVKSVPDVRNLPSPMDGLTAAEPESPEAAFAEANRPTSAPLASAMVGKVPPEVREAHSRGEALERGERADRAERTERGEHSFRKSLMGRFRKDKSPAVDESSVNEWLGVDENFDARSVGKARGSWESFRDDSDGFDLDSEFGTDDSWRGGAYSRKSLGHVDMRSGVDAEAEIPEVILPPEAEEKKFVTGEMERIYHFRNPVFNTEIWFVAIGCDNDSHDGIRAFIDQHKAELRGSMVIDIESLGAGTLSVASREGEFRKLEASSRIKRNTREATAATGVALNEVSLAGSESIASVVQRAGFQAMHLFGAEGGQIALKGSADDVLENVDELVFHENVKYVFELLKR